MENIELKCASLRAQIAAAEARLSGLRKELEMAEKAASAESCGAIDGALNTDLHEQKQKQKWPLSAEEYKRYGRQMIVPQIGLQGQLRLRASSVLLVGAGGLGCPAALYLAGAGLGTLGLVDGDTVESSNLHRQVLHRSTNVGKFKVDSAIEYLQELNPHPKYVAHREPLSSQNAPDIFQNYDVILDCTDNPATRYLISDTAVLLGKPLVSASALRTDGQLMVLNNPPRPTGDPSGGPCYRCVFPKPPPAEGVISCADGGILGPVVGTMGVLQALETIRLITRASPEQNATDIPGHASMLDEKPSLHIFSAYSSPPFRTIRLRTRRTNCAVCSSQATVTLDTLRSGSTDYVQFCGSASPPQVLSPQERISVRDYQSVPESGSPFTLIDVRDRVQFGICSLENSINIPITTMLNGKPGDVTNGDSAGKEWPSWLPPDVASANSSSPIYVVCRLGNDSQLAVRRLKEIGLDRHGERFIGDIRGGFKAWKAEIDTDWPEY